MTDLSIKLSSLVLLRKEAGLTQSDVARSLGVTQPAVARLEKKLQSEADVTLTGLVRYAKAIGLGVDLSFTPKNKKRAIFENASDAIAFAVHSSACEGMVTPAKDIENLWQVARGETSADRLIEHYIQEAIKEDRARNAG